MKRFGQRMAYMIFSVPRCGVVVVRRRRGRRRFFRSATGRKRVGVTSVIVGKMGKPVIKAARIIRIPGK